MLAHRVRAHKGAEKTESHPKMLLTLNPQSTRGGARQGWAGARTGPHLGHLAGRVGRAGPRTLLRL